MTPNKNEKLGNCIWFYLLRKHLPPTHQQKGSIYLITYEESFRSSYHSQTLSLPAQAVKFWNREDQNKVSPHTILWYELFAHMYVSIGQKYSVSKVLFSLLICMYWPSRTSTSYQSEIFCLIAWTPLAFPLFVWAEREYFTLAGCAGPGRPIHMYEQREQDFGNRIFLTNRYIRAVRMPFIYLHGINWVKVRKNQIYM